MFFRRHDYANAIKMLLSASELAEKVGLSPEQRVNVDVNLATCQTYNNDYRNAEHTLERADRLFTESKVDNPALRIRLLRRRTYIAEYFGKFEGAAKSQLELCKIYEKSIGRMVLGNFSEMGRLQHLELRCGHFQRSVEVGREALGLMSKFRITPNTDVFVRTNLTQGIALIFAGQVREGCDHLQKMYGPASRDSADLAAYAAAWLVHCARVDKNEAQRALWTKRLDKVAEASHTTPAFWLERVDREARDGPG
ncbi:MAG: hypothetical protein K2W95_32430 [Candidatus Obscuribacterales bacterium]|nr:hypothetical protein [Candidatus Obscuribacterales bacterium]